MDDLYILSDSEIRRKIGQRVRHLRLRQNITQRSLAEQAQISMSSVKKIESGAISSFDSLMRVLRILGELDVLSPMLREEEMSPNEYLEFVESTKKKMRRRAAAPRVDNDSLETDREDLGW